MDRLEIRFGKGEDDLIAWLEAIPHGQRATRLKTLMREEIAKREKAGRLKGILTQGGRA